MYVHIEKALPVKDEKGIALLVVPPCFDQFAWQIDPHKAQ